MIKAEEVAKLTELARIEVAPEEQEKLRQDLSKILDYVSELKEADQLGKVEPSVEGSTLPTTLPSNVWREDEVLNPGGESRDKLLAAAPATLDNYFKVKKILG